MCWMRTSSQGLPLGIKIQGSELLQDVLALRHFPDNHVTTSIKMVQILIPQREENCEPYKCSLPEEPIDTIDTKPAYHVSAYRLLVCVL